MRRAVFLVAAGLVVLAPALRPDAPDGFPLSSYPMFADDRGRVVSLATVVAFDADGRLHRLDPHAIGGGDEVMLAASAATAAVAGGPGEARRFCEEVAGRLDGRPELVTVEVRTERRDAVADPGADRPPLDVRTWARCRVRAEAR